MTDIDKLIAQLKAHAEAWEVKGTDNRDELMNERVMAFDCLTALEEIQRLRAIEAAAREVAANVEDDIDARLRYVVVQPSREEWVALKAAFAAKETP